MRNPTKDIKETLEAMDALKVMLVAFAKVFKDGKIDLKDSLILIDLLKEIGIIIDGIKGIKDIPGEIGDLQREEAVALGQKAYEILVGVQKA